MLHAGLLALYSAGGWRGTLILGASGAGKSDLGLRLINAGWRLVADDRVRVWRSAGRLFGRAPEALHGLIEARGVGVLPAPALDWCEVTLVALLEPEPERVPEPEWREVDKVKLPVIRLASFEASAPAKLALRMQKLARLGAGA